MENGHWLASKIRLDNGRLKILDSYNNNNNNNYNNKLYFLVGLSKCVFMDLRSNVNLCLTLRNGNLKSPEAAPSSFRYWLRGINVRRWTLLCKTPNIVMCWTLVHNNMAAQYYYMQCSVVEERLVEWSGHSYLLLPTNRWVAWLLGVGKVVCGGALSSF